MTKLNLTILFMAPILWTSLTAQAQETTAIEVDAGVMSVCQEAIATVRQDVAARAEADHACETPTEAEWMTIRSSCYTLERMNLATMNRMYDLLDPGNTITFNTAAEAEEAIRSCRPVVQTVCAPDAPPSAVPPAAHRAHDRFHLTCLHGRLEGRPGSWAQECVCPVGTERLRGDDIYSHYEGDHAMHVDRDVTYVVIDCYSATNPAARTEAARECNDWSEEIENHEMRISRLEHQVCDAPSAHPGFQALCDRVRALELEVGPSSHSRIDALETEYTQLVDDDWATCDNGDHYTREEWRELTPERRVEICGQFHDNALVDNVGSGGSGGGANHDRFLVSGGLLLGYDGASNTVPVYGQMRAQFEFAITEMAWFYARADGGWGTLNDGPNWIGTVPIAESAFWGFGAGVSLDLEEHITLSLGASYHGLLNYGPTRRDELIGEYRGHRVTGDVGLRLVANPRDTVRFFGELDVSAGWSLVFGEHNGAAVPLNSAGIYGVLSVGLMF